MYFYTQRNTLLALGQKGGRSQDRRAAQEPRLEFHAPLARRFLAPKAAARRAETRDRSRGVPAQLWTGAAPAPGEAGSRAGRAGAPPPPAHAGRVPGGGARAAAGSAGSRRERASTTHVGGARSPSAPAGPKAKWQRRGERPRGRKGVGRHTEGPFSSSLRRYGTCPPQNVSWWGRGLLWGFFSRAIADIGTTRC